MLAQKLQIANQGSELDHGLTAMSLQIMNITQDFCNVCAPRQHVYAFDCVDLYML